MTLCQLAALGPLFAVETHQPDAAPRSGWRPMSELVEDPAALRARVAETRGRLPAAGGSSDTTAQRVAVSLTHLGLTTRIVFPTLAVAATCQSALLVSLRDVWWRPVPGSAFPLSLPAGSLAATASEPALANRLAASLGCGPVRALVDAAGRMSLSPRVLWGNVASAVNGAAEAIGAASPAHAEQARRLADDLLGRPPLREAAGRDAAGRFQRRSCCLIYRLAPTRAGALCQDCVLAG